MTKEIFYEHFKLIQSQIDKYDELSAKIKTWTVTVWVALLGWSFKDGQRELVLLSLVVIIIFWLLDAVNKNFRQDYKKLREEILDSLNKKEDISFSFPKHKVLGFFKQLFKPHLFLVYFTLLILSVLAYF